MQVERNYVIETRNLEFGFSKKNRLLKDINLKVETGSIYGFLGPNGAGKTTTIRLLLGLLKDGSGSIHLFGKTLSKNRIEILSRTGALIELPSLYEHLSGFDNLEITRRLKKAGKEKVDEVMEIVRLTEAADKKVKAYSLGMKQRLGIALALLGQPDLLILDEPVNGLDPNGMMEMRELLKTINRKYNITIFLSSHLISEIEKIVTHVGIINMGKLLFQGSVGELRNLGKKEMHLHIHVGNTVAAIGFLSKAYIAVEKGNEIDILIKSEEQAGEIVKQLVENGITVYEAVIESVSLEQIFLTMTKNYAVR
ncbi:MAG: ABC transporter ATP-binding protein [Bacteroidia bacterium]